jgi:2,5-diketo-D-gluconate reductase A
MSTLERKVALPSGREMPTIGLGTWPMNDAEVRPVVAKAIEIGYRLIDTAARYGNERGVGEGIRGSGIDRTEIFITTKIRGADHGASRSRQAILASLERLGTTYLDMVLIHWPLPRLGLYIQSYETMLDLVREGLICSVGVSNFKPHHVARLVQASAVVPAVNQIQMSVALPRTESLSALQAQGVHVQAWGPLGQRHALIGSPVVRSIAEVRGVTSAQVLLRWLIQRGVSAVPKSASENRQRENLDIYDLVLTKCEIAKLAGLACSESDAIDSDIHEEF